MARLGFKLQIRPGAEEEYKRRHQVVYPELIEAFQENGIQTYSIFMDGTTLFAYLEAEDIEQSMQAIERHPANIRWQKYMEDILIADMEGKTVHILSEVFHCKF
ncbi:L-rhamnose mutarotase [Alicyclobacillus sp. TC]|uniref:L-rhamnose mutarotase n=2 Tax=Alicyclobacillus tolerans TaxID=90970 RepID=A0A1M6NLK6_9BACL|nr:MULTISPECIES: L-rhamnose mutarotase [Alicyclobacillus]MDP9727475.1 L-rhamnose mutarotase [Alicyclobacillus tengchongensis]QRF23924.1 L-rhamnose mutarotase [Alicyclobacillus sp. TC]SHJ96559.1 L-rhamnose mutarotase [Alicyclobacillus montanus]